MEEIKKVRGNGQVQTSVLLSKEFYDLCKANNIKFTEALRVGISLMLADIGIAEYDNRLNLYRRMQSFKIELERVSQEFELFKNKVKEKELKEDLSKEFERVMNNAEK